MYGWFDPLAFLVAASLLNATHFMYFTPNGTAVYFYQHGLYYVPATREEDSAVYMYIQQLCRFTAFKPAYITYGENYVVATGDVYCSPDGVRWAWLRWLPLRLTAFKGNITMMQAQATAETALGVFTGQLPEGWYRTDYAVVRLPDNASLLARVFEAEAELARLRNEAEALRVALKNATEAVKALESAKASVERRVAEAEADAQRLNSLYKQCTAERASLSQQLGEAKKRAEEAVVAYENATKVASSLVAEVESLRSQLSAAQEQIATLEAALGEESWRKWLFLALGLAVAGAVTAVAVLALKRREGV